MVRGISQRFHGGEQQWEVAYLVVDTSLQHQLRVLYPNSMEWEQQRADLPELAYILPFIFVVPSGLRTHEAEGQSATINVSR